MQIEDLIKADLIDFCEDLTSSPPPVLLLFFLSE